MTTTLTATKRDMKTKAKALRRQGKITGNISGKDLPGSISIQLDAIEAGRFLKDHKEGSQLNLDLGDEKYNVLIKEISFQPSKHQYDNIEFQLLVAGEKVNCTVPIILTNTEAVHGYLTQNLAEVSFKAIPSALVEKIEIDAATLPVNESLLVSDLDIAKTDAIDMITPMDTIILHISEHQKGVMEETAEEAEA